MIRRAFVDGVRRVTDAPAIILGVYLVTVLSTLPLALVLRGELADHLASSLMADAAADGVNWDWWQEFSGQASRLGSTFGPAIIGFAAPLDNLSGLLDGDRLALPVLVAVGLFGGTWMFLWGGILDRYARARPVRASAFFAAAGTFFFRFLRLGVAAALLYWLILGPLHGWLFGRAYDWLTEDLTSERLTFLWRVGLYAAFGIVLVAVNVVMDYAKIRAVVEDRRSMLGALIGGIRFVVRHPRGAVGLYVANGVAFLLVLALYAALAPGVGGAGWHVGWTLLVGQAYIAARLFLRLLFAASQTCFFQARLAHAGYTATPLPTWPESPSVEAITNAARQAGPPPTRTS